MTKIEALLDIMDKYRNLNPPGSGEPFPRDVVARYALEALPELRALRWIPVEERLPDEDSGKDWDGWLLVRVEFRWSSGFTAFIDVARFVNGRWENSLDYIESEDGPGNYHVTHWREIGPGPGGVE